MKRFFTLISLIALSLAAAPAVAQDTESQDAELLTRCGKTARCATVPKQDAGPRMDVVFTIDATSSMADEIEVIKKEIWTIANKLISGKPTPDIRFGLVLYRDTTDQKLVEVTPLTRDIDMIHKKLMAAQAVGGGDKPEHVGKGLHSTLDLAWDMDAETRRLVYLVGDAGANNHETFTLASALDRATQMNIKINTIGCSGLQSDERAEFTKIASTTGGGFDALTYYAVVEDSDGSKKSVVYHDGKAYESEGEISDEEWKKGGAKVIASRKMKRAKADTTRRAASAPKRNNLDASLADDMVENAESMGVSY